MINRREALKAVSALFGTTIIGSQAFLAGCAGVQNPANGGAASALLNAADVALLDEIGETILPTTPDSPGAKAAQVGAFIQTIVMDCFSPEEQQVFRDGLRKLNADTQAQHGQPFPTLTAPQKHAHLLTLEDEVRALAETQAPEDAEMHYYSMIKQLTVWGYFSSEIGATQALRYLPVPGRYEGCIPYNEGEKAWAL